MPGTPRERRLSFGAFEVSPATAELYKNGIRITLHGKPCALLLALLERPGEVVTRKALQKRLWPGQTFLQFDNGLNNVVRRLRETLGDTAKNPRYIETIPNRGYRFLLEVSRGPAVAETESASKRWPMIAALSAAAVILGAVVFYAARPPSRTVRSLAVLPFREMGRGSLGGHFASGMTDAVTTDLAKLGALKVVSEGSSARFKNTTEAVPHVAKALGVDAVVQGRIFQDKNQVRITVQLVRAHSDRDIWADSYERQVTNVLALQDQVAQVIARAIDLKLTPAVALESHLRKGDRTR